MEIISTKQDIFDELPEHDKDVELKPVSEIPIALRRRFDRSWLNSHGLYNSEKKSKPSKYLSTDDSLVQYMHSIGRNPLLTKDGEIFLSQVIERGKLSDADTEDYWAGVWAKDKLVVSNLRLVVSVAKKCVRIDSSSNLLDLIQDGTIGLGRAAEKYDWRKGFKFSTYATWWIRQSIGRSSMNDDFGIYLPSHKRDLIKRLNKAESIVESSGESVTSEKIAKVANLRVREVEELLSLRRLSLLVSLDKSVSKFVDATDTESSLGDMVGEKDLNYEIIEDKFCADAIKSVLGRINERDRDILARRHGMHPYEPHSLEEVGLIYGLTRERVRQIERRALEDLKNIEDIVEIWEAYY